jgi:hypothetical protein
MMPRAALALAFAATWGVAHAQTTGNSVRAVPQPKAPVFAPGAVGPGAPNPAGLPSPLPNPAGLTSRFPAGLPAPAINPAGSTTGTDTAATTPATTDGSQPADSSTTAPQTATLGAVAAGGVPANPQYSRLGSGPFTALELAQSFLAADANMDGELTRAEAQRLRILPYSFEEMDRNHDGILSRFEYEDGVR